MRPGIDKRYLPSCSRCFYISGTSGYSRNVVSHCGRLNFFGYLRISCKKIKQAYFGFIIGFYSSNLSEKVISSDLYSDLYSKLYSERLTDKIQGLYRIQGAYVCPYRRRSFEAYCVACSVEEQRFIQIEFSFLLNDAVWFK